MISLHPDQVRQFSLIGFDTKADLVKVTSRHKYRNFYGRPKSVQCPPTLRRGVCLVGFYWSDGGAFFKDDLENREVHISSPVGDWYHGLLIGGKVLSAFEEPGGKFFRVILRGPTNKGNREPDNE